MAQVILVFANTIHHPPHVHTNLVFKRRNIQAIEQINTCQKCVPQRFHCLSTSRDRYKTLKALIKIDVQTPFRRKTRMIYRRGLAQRCVSENTAIEAQFATETSEIKPIILTSKHLVVQTRTVQTQQQIKSKNHLTIYRCCKCMFSWESRSGIPLQRKFISV